MQGDQVEELNQLEIFLRQPDAVMEPNILSVLRRYISDKGRPADAVEMLCDSYAGLLSMYRFLEANTITVSQGEHVQSTYTLTNLHIAAGYAQMASLVVDWTKELQDEGNLGDGSASVAAFDEAYYLRVSRFKKCTPPYPLCLPLQSIKHSEECNVGTRRVSGLNNLLQPGTRQGPFRS